jgi:hypothetical protein
LSKPQRSTLDRLFSKVERTPDGCWLWTGALKVNGYAQLQVGGRTGKRLYAHRVAYELLVGPIPDGLQLDHLCRVRHCVNPAHLEPVTARENVRRGEPAQRTHCPKGHEYTAENTFVKTGGWRECRTCYRARNRAYYRRKQRQA